jgi:hypothetical protein
VDDVEDRGETGDDDWTLTGAEQATASTSTTGTRGWFDRPLIRIT